MGQPSHDTMPEKLLYGRSGIVTNVANVANVTGVAV
jgi:hypothetical protein